MVNQRPITFAQTQRASGKPKVNDLSAQAVLTIKMGNVLVKVRNAVEKEEQVILTHGEARLLLTIIRQSIDRAKAMEKAANMANERARRARKR